MRRCVTCVKLCVFMLGLVVLGSMMMDIGYTNRVTYFCVLYVLIVVHSLAVLKGHPGCLKCGKTLWRPGLRPGPR